MSKVCLCLTGKTLARDLEVLEKYQPLGRRRRAPASTTWNPTNASISGVFLNWRESPPS